MDKWFYGLNAGNRKTHRDRQREGETWSNLECRKQEGANLYFSTGNREIKFNFKPFSPFRRLSGRRRERERKKKETRLKKMKTRKNERKKERMKD